MPDIPVGYRRVEGSERRPVAGARRVGPADPNETLSVSVYLRSQKDAPPLPALEDWMSPRTAGRAFLSPEEFGNLYGADPGDIERVTAFGRANGMTVVEVNAARRVVVLSGTVAQMNKSFAVDLGSYESYDQAYRGREGYVHLPDDLAGIVEGVFGLDNRRASRQHATMTPSQVAGLYNFPTGKATGQTIGILEFGGGFATSDINQYLGPLGLSTPTLNVVKVDGIGNTPAGSATSVWLNNPLLFPVSDPDIEVTLDIDVAAAVAQGATIALYFAPNTEQGWVDALTTVLADTTNNPSVLSISWGKDEASWTPSLRYKIQLAFQSAAAQGVTVFVAAGDLGSDDGVNDGKAHVQYPASDPWVTACGGTVITTVSPLSEDTWNDASGATGGGISSTSQPQYQNGSGIPPSVNDGTTIGRGVPDIAGNASGNSGYNLVLYGTRTNALTITSGKNAGGPVGLVGGTSAVAPLYAGLTAIINTNLGRRVGILTPYLYLIGNTPWLNVFGDINDGVSNSVSFTTPLGVNGTSLGYKSGPGWDACTGWGVANGIALQDALIQSQIINNVDTTPDAPAVSAGITASGDPVVQLFWKANDGSNAIYTATSGNGIDFTPGYKISNVDSTPESPAACQFNLTVYVFWKANDPSNRIYYSSSADGVNFTASKVISNVDATPDSPVPCVFLQHIFLYWKSNDSNAIYASSSLNGVDWALSQQINHVDITPEAPTACVLNGRMFLFWKADDSSNSIYVSSSTDGINFPQGRKINNADSTPESPAACVVNNRIFLFWKANDGSNSIYWSVSSDGIHWPQGRKVDYLDHTPDTPVPAVLGSNLFLYWEADDSTNLIYGVGWPFSLFK